MTHQPAPDDFEPLVRKVCREFEATSLASLADEFSRLVFLASLRDYSTDGYIHWGLSQTYGEEVAQAALGILHRQLFRDTGALSLPELTRQVREFLEQRTDGGKKLLRNWQRDFAYNLLAPAGAAALELENFRINFEAVMAVLSRQDPS
jgi:hypothetical protein